MNRENRYIVIKRKELDLLTDEAKEARLLCPF